MPGDPGLRVAGVGASAGGLEAMLPIFAGLRANGRDAFVVAQHMAKDGHDTLVARLIGRESPLPVVLAEDGMTIGPDTIYLIPSGKDGKLRGERLHLVPPAPGHISTPSVNALFESIAESQTANGLGIVLSGTGSDGTLGCRAIRARGGITIAQDPLEAKFDGMPAAAIDAQQVDHILPVAAIGRQFAEWFPGTAPGEKRAAGLDWSLAERVADYDDPAATNPAYRELRQLLPQILRATRIDFSSYKEDTLLRRLEKRKATLGIDSAEAYQEFIRRQPEELHTLQHLFLVSLSSFFRDRESFAALREALAGLLAARPESEPLRVWVPACASGEEAYTLAILLRELDARRPLEIIGTDLNPEALALAEAGRYRQTAFRETEPDILGRYFIPHGQHHAVSADIRACVRFEQRDVLTGAPPGEFDLVSCRNLLIYMKSHLQDRLVKDFHHALRAQGLLFIGQSESLSFVGNSLFVAVDHFHRLFRRRH